VIHYALGHYGPVPAPIRPDVLDRILSSQRARKLQSWVRPDPSLTELRRKFASGISDEELLLRFMMSDEEVDTMIAKGPIRTDPRRSANHIVEAVTELIAEQRNVTSFAVTTPEFSVNVRSGER
jgi:oxaloacetate decarboxylase alpha subunit